MKKPAPNSTFAIGGVSCSAESFVVTESAVLRMNICAEKPAHRKSANPWVQAYQTGTANIKLKQNRTNSQRAMRTLRPLKPLKNNILRNVSLTNKGNINTFQQNLGIWKI